MDVELVPPPTPLGHQPDVVERFERPEEDGCGVALPFSHCVHQTVDPVIQIHVGDAWRAVKRRIPPGRPARCVTRGIVLSDVCLGFDNHPGSHTGRGAVHEHLSHPFPGHGQRGTGIKRPRENGAHVRQFMRASVRLAART
jgi:hypothetical protein